jgi:hypothetical protein
MSATSTQIDVDCHTLNSSHMQSGFDACWWCRLLVALACVLLAAGGSATTRAADRSQKVFASPEEAVQALSSAWHGGMSAELRKIFGPPGNRLVDSGDPIAEKQARQTLAAAYDKHHRIEYEGQGKAVLVMGGEEWPYPVPLLKRGSWWRFDAKAGAEQIVDRRIGRNELNAIEVCRSYVAAQHDYASKTRSAGGLHEYARKFASTQGKRDGLYWQAAANDAESPLGPLVAAAEAQGYEAASAEGRAPFHGYYYRILSQQGKAVPGGAKDYIVDGHMTGGFALLAYPAKYANSGVMTFVVNQEGIVYEKNLGRDTAAIARRMKIYDPDQSWRVVAH